MSDLEYDDAFLAALERVASGESSSEPLPGPGGEGGRLSLDPEAPGVILLEFPEADVTSRMFIPTPTRPPGFPERVPFVAGCWATWSELPNSERTMSWVTKDDAEALFELLADEMGRDAWTAIEAIPAFEGSLREASFLKHGRVRTLVLQLQVEISLVSLLEMDALAPADT